MGPSAIARTIRTMTIRTISHTPMATMGEEVIADQMPAHTPCKIVGNGFAGEVGVSVGVGGILCSTTRVPRPISELAELCHRREIEIVATRGTADRRSSQPKLVRELPGRARRLLQRVRCRRQVGPADGIHLAAQPFADAGALSERATGTPVIKRSLRDSDELSPRPEVAVQIELHRALLAKLIGDLGTLRELAHRNIDRMRAVARSVPAQKLLDEWVDILDGPPDRLIEVFLEANEHSIDLRQMSPFAGALSDEERVAAIHRARHRATL
jgi:hypothetical protein